MDELELFREIVAEFYLAQSTPRRPIEHIVLEVLKVKRFKICRFECTLEEVSDILQMDKEKVRQIQDGAFKKLKGNRKQYEVRFKIKGERGLDFL